MTALRTEYRSPQGGRALAGVKVVEWAQFIAGPYCAKLMADLGAEVIKIETPGLGDEARHKGPFLHDQPHPERSGLFLWVNTNKRGITLDVASPAGGKIFRQLVARADILVEDKSPQALKEMGLDYPSLAAINPGLIMTSITPFGATGPYSAHKAYPLNSFHSGGEGYMTPWITPFEAEKFRSLPPVRVAKYFSEYASGVSSAGATLCALWGRRATGRGQFVDISKQHALLFLAWNELQRYPHYGRYSSRFTQVYRFAGQLPCKDGFIEFGPTRPEHWAAFAEILAEQGDPEWATNPNLRDRTYLEDNVQELRPRAFALLRKLTRQELYEKARAKRTPIAPFYNVGELTSNEQLQWRQFFQEVEHPEAGKALYPSAPYQFSGTPWRVERPAPLLGQHNQEVYCQLLGHSQQELVKLRQAGVI